MTASKQSSDSIGQNTDRDYVILKMRREDASPKEIARRFDITPGRVLTIVRDLEAEERFQNWKVQFLKDLRQADDLDRKWPGTQLVDALVRSRVHTALVKHFGNPIRGISLRDLMDLAASETAAERGEFPSPLVRLRNIGKYGVRDVIRALTDSDFGERCNAEWRRRLKILDSTPYGRERRGHNS